MSATRLLLVDDEKAFLDTIKKRLEKRQIKIRTAGSGAEALASLKDNGKVDIVILDVKMPGMDGIETLKHIKTQFPLVEVIMLTGHATVETAIDGMKLGAFDYLMKPCDINVLIDKVNTAMGKKQAHEIKIMEARIREITERRA